MSENQQWCLCCVVRGSVKNPSLYSILDSVGVITQPVLVYNDNFTCHLQQLSSIDLCNYTTIYAIAETFKALFNSSKDLSEMSYSGFFLQYFFFRFPCQTNKSRIRVEIVQTTSQRQTFGRSLLLAPKRRKCRKRSNLPSLHRTCKNCSFLTTPGCT